MDDARRREFAAFLALHGASARPTDEPVAHLHFASAGPLPPGGALVALTREDVLDALDPDSELVRWLLEQMRTYDCRTQRIVGLAWDRRTVLSDVLRMPSEWRGG
jgi:hypothetical protein